MELRAYRKEDCPALAELFYETVHSVCAKDYTQEQLRAWAGGCVDLQAWNSTFLAHTTLVAQEGGIITGFGDIDATGYLDRLYVHRNYQRKGVATLLCNALEAAVAAPTIVTHASITAKPFFERRGYRVEREQHVERGGILLTNYVMRRERCRPGL